MQKKPTTRLGRSCIRAIDRSMKTFHGHKQHRKKNSLRDVILGGQDGLVNMLGIALGVVAARGSNHVFVVTGIAAAITASISMGAVAADSKNKRGVAAGEAATGL
jgi:VIT family